MKRASRRKSSSNDSEFESLEFRHLSHYYHDKRRGEVQTLSDVTLSVGKNEFVTIVGPSGCGKSTLFNLASGLVRPTGGTILVNGSPMEGNNEHIAYMFQRDGLLDWRTVAENAMLGQEFLGVSKKVARQAVADGLEAFGLSAFQARRPYELSGGMRQRVALLRTYLTNRPLLLLDEPFGALDALTRLKMQEFLLRHWEADAGRSVLFITHDVEEALLLGDRVIVLSSRPAHVRAEVEVDFPRPRNSKSVMVSEQFVSLKRDLLRMLYEEE